MINLFDTSISIEKFAAYLDGNLPEGEMNELSSMIESNSELQAFANVNTLIDDTINGYSKQDIELPLELQSKDFEIPSFSDLVTDNDSSEDTGFFEELNVACRCNEHSECFSINSDDNSLEDSSSDNIETLDGNSFVNENDTQLEDTNCLDQN